MLVKLLIRIVAIVAIIYLGILVFLIANETRLVYPGSKYPRGDWQPTAFPFDEVTFQAEDGTQLVGWYLPPPNPTNNPSATNRDATAPKPIETVLLCHGNAENIAQAAAHNGYLLRQSLNAEVFVFDYRGFGKSEGTPDEPGILQDSEAALKWLQQKSGKALSEIIIVGHSIGGGPAVHMAALHQPKLLILQRTFDAITSPAQVQYPWLPIKYVMSNRFPSAEKVKDYTGPVFQSHGRADRLIPIAMGKTLFNAAPTKDKQFFEVPEMTHWDALPSEYWSELAAFASRVRVTDQ
jgi:fermentation-respiration switch protein FrsA (DUF1100 family)